MISFVARLKRSGCGKLVAMSTERVPDRSTREPKSGDPLPRLGLALGGGAARGLAHLGVLRAFERAGVVPDVICGTSSGAIIGGSIASGLRADALIEIALELRWTELVRLSVRRDRIFDTTGLDELISSVITTRDFDDLHVAFASVAQDRATGERVVLKRGDPVRAAAASAAIRGAFAPVEIEGRALIDGIDVDPIPARAARELGATYVVAVDVLRMTTIRKVRTRLNRRADRADGDADVTISPLLGSRAAWDFAAASEMIALGETAAESAIPAIKAAMNATHS
jgi:NTE family protein